LVSPEEEALLQATRQAIQAGMSPDQAADIIFQAIQAEQLYIFTHPEMKAWVRTQMEYMLAEQNPPLNPG
jgi:hypothetical protein